jgi:hypothetical protein
MSTYRERRLARAEKLRGWSASNEAKGDAAYERAHDIGAMIPMGQPILVGHHSERRHRRDIARIDAGMRASIELADKAARQASSADEIERQAAAAVYDDDPDAIERLEAKLAGLEAKREAYKAKRAEIRKTHREALKGKTAWEKEEVMRAAGAPQYSITNLGGNITRTRDRIARLKREKETGPRDRIITARRTGKCETCGAAIERGDTIRYNRQQGARCYPGCEGAA